MWDNYLLPEDVSAAHAREVLNFLNQAPSAETIAEAVEFTHERDVGVRVAQRILARRTELNGFRTLDQLYAVPYVGPERFTEIVVSLSGARPPRRVSGISTTELADFRAGLDQLRSLIQAGAKARLWSLQGTMWLGQNATLLAHVQDATGRPLVDQPVTFTTTWGELYALGEVQTIAGNAITARTNDAGLVELRLRTRFQAPLSDTQRVALELAAGRLPAKAAWPTAATAQLIDLVRQYRAPGSDDLREAIDAAFREYGASAQRAEHRGQALAQWGRIPVSIACFVHDQGDDRGHRHLALVTHTMEVRTWLPAFLAAFEQDVARDRRLAEELKRAPTATEDANVFLNDVFISVRSFLNTERGELGQSLRTRAAQDELQQFFQTNVAALPEKVRLDALAGVRDASATIGQGGLPMFKAVESTRRDLTGTFEFNADLLAGAIQGVQTDLKNLETNLQTQFTGQLGALESNLSAQIAVKADQTRVDTLTATTVALRRDLDSKADRATIDGLNTRLDRLDTRVDRDLGRLVTNVDTLTATTATLRRDVDLKADRTAVDRLDTRVDRIDTRLPPR